MELNRLDDTHRPVAEQARTAIMAIACGREAVGSTVSVMEPSVNETPQNVTANSYETIPRAS